MKKWRGTKNRHELYLAGEPVCVLYHDDDLGYWCKAHIDGGSRGESFGDCSLYQAKLNTEAWYKAVLESSYRMHRRCEEICLARLQEMKAEYIRPPVEK